MAARLLGARSDFDQAPLRQFRCREVHTRVPAVVLLSAVCSFGGSCLPPRTTSERITDPGMHHGELWPWSGPLLLCGVGPALGKDHGRQVQQLRDPAHLRVWSAMLASICRPASAKLLVTIGRGKTALRRSVPSIVRSSLAERPFADPPEATIHP